MIVQKNSKVPSGDSTGSNTSNNDKVFLEVTAANESGIIIFGGLSTPILTLQVPSDGSYSLTYSLHATRSEQWVAGIFVNGTLVPDSQAGNQNPDGYVSGNTQADLSDGDTITLQITNLQSQTTDIEVTSSETFGSTGLYYNQI